MVSEESLEQHESYGLARFSRVSTTDSILFGSSLSHNHTITLSISAAEKGRSLNNNWYNDTKELIEVEMSQDQFAELITTLNCGTGIPCTIRRLQGKRMEDPPHNSTRKVFEDEFERHTSVITEKIEKVSSKLKELSEAKSVSKASLKEALSGLDNMIMEIRSNLPYIYNQFNKSMDKTIVEAKAEVEAFVNHTITSLGVEAVRNKFPQITDGEDRPKITGGCS